MENPPLNILVALFCLAALVLVSPETAKAQGRAGNQYELDTAPDLWYNSVDGVRVGLRLRGHRAGTFRDGPHRLDAGIWLSTFFPEVPVSYYVSFTEPIPSLSAFNSEGNVRLRSSIRTGYHNHSISFNKRWQPGFEERNYRELTVSLRGEKRFENEYLLYPRAWQDQWLYLAGINFRINNSNFMGRYRITSKTSANIGGPHPAFLQGRIAVQQRVPIGTNIVLRARLFGAAASENTAPEYLFNRSLKPYHAWDEMGVTRARGTIPTPWIRAGSIQVAGGASLRGYTNQDIERFNEGNPPLLNSMAALNLELEYPNPVDRMLNAIPFAGLFNFRTYLFFDSGTALGVSGDEDPVLHSDAGPGFMLSLNIPDYLGKSRGFALRYEIPLWLSHPAAGEEELQFRHLIGIGAVISL